jgi:hypothetical protein
MPGVCLSRYVSEHDFNGRGKTSSGPDHVSGHDFSRAERIPTSKGLQPLRNAGVGFLLTFALLLFAGCKKKESPPPKPHEKSAIIATQAAPGSAFIMSLAMDPAQPKFGRKTNFRATVKQTLGTPVDGAQVEISLVMPLMDMGKNQFALKPAGNGAYEGTGEFTMAGEWEVIVTANAQGKSGKTTFNVNVVE